MVARVLNSWCTKGSDTLAPLLNPRTGQHINPFPNTLDDLSTINAPSSVALLLALGLQPGQIPAHVGTRRNMIKERIGIKPWKLCWWRFGRIRMGFRKSLGAYKTSLRIKYHCNYTSAKEYKPIHLHPAISTLLSFYPSYRIQIFSQGWRFTLETLDYLKGPRKYAMMFIIWLTLHMSSHWRLFVLCYFFESLMARRLSASPEHTSVVMRTCDIDSLKFFFSLRENGCDFQAPKHPQVFWDSEFPYHWLLTSREYCRQPPQLDLNIALDPCFTITVRCKEKAHQTREQAVWCFNPLEVPRLREFGLVLFHLEDRKTFVNVSLESTLTPASISKLGVDHKIQLSPRYILKYS